MQVPYGIDWRYMAPQVPSSSMGAQAAYEARFVCAASVKVSYICVYESCIEVSYIGALYMCLRILCRCLIFVQQLYSTFMCL